MGRGHENPSATGPSKPTRLEDLRELMTNIATEFCRGLARTNERRVAGCPSLASRLRSSAAWVSGACRVAKCTWLGSAPAAPQRERSTKPHCTTAGADLSGVV